MYYDTDITVEGLCRELSIGKTRLYQLCKARQGKTVVQMVQERRMEAAKELLTTTDHPIQFISGTVGILDFNYFFNGFQTLYRSNTEPVP